MSGSAKISAETEVFVTFFDDWGAHTNVERVWRLDDLGEKIRSTNRNGVDAEAAKAVLPWVKLARFGNAKTKKGGSLRFDRNVIACTGCEGDFDKETISFEEAVEIAEKADLGCLIYTSPRHLLAGHGPRWRILCPTSTEITPERRWPLVSRINGLFRGSLAVESWKLSQSYYFGSVNNNPAHNVVLIEGEPIDLLDELDRIAIDQPKVGGRRTGNGTAQPSSGGKHKPSLLGPTADPLDVAAALAVIGNDEVDWERWSYIGMAIWAATRGSAAGEAAFLAWSEKIGDDDFDETKTGARWAEITGSPPSGEIGAGTLFHLAREAWPGFEKPSEIRRRRDNDPGEPPPHITGTLGNIEPDPADSEPEPPRGNGRDPEPEPESVNPPVGGGDNDDRATQAHGLWGDPAAPSFRDPWLDPTPPDWPPDALPPRFHDMVFELGMSAGLDPGAQGIATLSAASGAAPKNARFYPYGTAERWSVPPVIWAMIIQQSGQRKSALDTPFEALQRKHSQLWVAYRAKLRAWRSLSMKDRNNTPKPPEPHSFIVTDTTPEKLQHVLSETERGTLLLRDELAGFFAFGRYGNDKGAAERAFYLESYEGGPYTVHRVTRDSFHIEVNGLTVFGRIQPERLSDFTDLQDDGLLQRFITIRMAKASVGRVLGTITGKTDFDERIDQLAELPGRSYRTTQEGSDIIRRMETDGIDFATLTDYGPGFSGFCGKLHGTLSRLSLILHLLDQPDPQITIIHPDVVLRAERLVRDFVLPHAVDFYSTLAHDRIERTRSIADWLLTSAPVKLRASDFGKHTRSCRGLSLAELNEALDPLVTGGWLDPATPFPSNREWKLKVEVRSVMVHRVVAAAARREENRRLAERIGKR